MVYLSLEHECCHRGRVPTHLRCGARWCSPTFALDWPGRPSGTAEERRHRHVRLWGSHPLHYPAQSSGLLLLDFGWWRADHRGVWLDWLSPLNEDPQ